MYIRRSQHECNLESIGYEVKPISLENPEKPIKMFSFPPTFGKSHPSTFFDKEKLSLLRTCAVVDSTYVHTSFGEVFLTECFFPAQNSRRRNLDLLADPVSSSLAGIKIQIVSRLWLTDFS
jgi:hypothetical protein